MDPLAEALERGKGQEWRQVPMFCPECRKMTVCTIMGAGIVADPSRPCLKCQECLVSWRVMLAFVSQPPQGN
jgi:hypothetical protein